MRQLKGIVLGFGLTLAAMSLLTACQNTAEGMKKDYQAATTPAPVHHKKAHKHKVKKTMTSTDQTTSAQPTQQTMTNEPAAPQSTTNATTQQNANSQATQQTTTTNEQPAAQQQNTTDTSNSY